MAATAITKITVIYFQLSLFFTTHPLCDSFSAMPPVFESTGLNVRLPVHSSRLKFVPLAVSSVLPGWLCFLAVGGLVANSGSLIWLSPSMLTCINTILLIAFIGRLAILVRFRWDEEQYATVHEDRLEMGSKGQAISTFYWGKIATNPDKEFDLVFEECWFEDSPHAGFCFRYAEEGLVLPVELQEYFYPQKGIGPAWKNVNLLRHAFLISLIKARPDLRIHDAVYTICRVDPATLEYNSLRRVSKGLAICMWVGLAAYFLKITISPLLEGLLFVNESLRQISIHAAVLPIGGLAVVCAVAFIGINRLVASFLARPEDPQVRQRRMRLLAQEKVRRQNTEFEATLKALRRTRLRRHSGPQGSHTDGAQGAECQSKH